MAELSGKDFIACVDLYDGAQGPVYIKAGESCERFKTPSDRTLSEALALAQAAGFIAPRWATPVAPVEGPAPSEQGPDAESEG